MASSPADHQTLLEFLVEGSQALCQAAPFHLLASVEGTEEVPATSETRADEGAQGGHWKNLESG